MNALEKLQELETKASEAPWGIDETEITCPPSDEGCFVEFNGAGDVDSEFIVHLRNLSPKIFAMWKAANAAGAKFNACMATFNGGEPTDLTEAACLDLHMEWQSFAITLNALNAEAKRVLE